MSDDAITENDVPEILERIQKAEPFIQAALELFTALDQKARAALEPIKPGKSRKYSRCELVAEDDLVFLGGFANTSGLDIGTVRADYNRVCIFYHDDKRFFGGPMTEVYCPAGLTAFSLQQLPQAIEAAKATRQMTIPQAAAVSELCRILAEAVDIADFIATSTDPFLTEIKPQANLLLDAMTPEIAEIEIDDDAFIPGLVNKEAVINFLDGEEALFIAKRFGEAWYLQSPYAEIDGVVGPPPTALTAAIINRQPKQLQK